MDVTCDVEVHSMGVAVCVVEVLSHWECSGVAEDAAWCYLCC